MTVAEYYIGLIVLAVVNLMIGPFWAKKLTNLADKEDLKKLTNDVESVKSQFARLNDREGKNYTLSQKALIDFYFEFTNSEYAVLQTNLTEYTIDNLNRLNEKINLMDNLIEKSRIAFNTLDLLMNDENIVIAGQDLVSALINLLLAVQENCKSHRILLLEQKTCLEHLDSKDYYRSSDEMRARWENNFAESHRKITFSLETFIPTIDPLLSKAKNAGRAFKESAKGYLHPEKADNKNNI